MPRLYSAQVARPLSAANSRPTRLGFATTAWCPHEDLVAVISGCGAVAVFHADSPGEVAMLVGPRRAPARHVAWRPARDKPIMLVVADAAARISFWHASDSRVNVWTVVAAVDVSPVVVAMNWNAPATALAAVLADGSLRVWLVPDYPPTDRRWQQRRAPRDQHARRPQDAKLASGIREVAMKQAKLPDLFGGALHCASIAPGSRDPASVALVTVSVVQPSRLSVWTVSISDAAAPAFDVRLISLTDMPPDTGACTACAVDPKSGILFTVSDRGVITRWQRRVARTDIDPGWEVQAQARIDLETERAIKQGVIPKPADPKSHTVSTTGSDSSRKRKVYAFTMFSNCTSILTSTAGGLFVWDAQKLQIISELPSQLSPEFEHDADVASPFWGLCVSPAGAAAFALNGRGYVNAYSLLRAVNVAESESTMSLARSVIQLLREYAHGDSPRGLWDVEASLASESAAASALVTKALSAFAARAEQNGTPSEAQLSLTSFVMRVSTTADCTAVAARRLLDVSVAALRETAGRHIFSILNEAQGAVSNMSSAAIAKAIRQYAIEAQNLRGTLGQLSAAPLADWILVLCAVWLQRCAAEVLKSNTEGQRMAPTWAALLNLSPEFEAGSGHGQGIAYEPQLIRTLKLAAFAAALLLALERERTDGNSVPRYYRFSLEDSIQLVAAVWEISVQWETCERTVRFLMNGSSQGSVQSGELRKGVAAVFNKHAALATTIANTPKLRAVTAERALGLHGAANGAGFIMSCLRARQPNDARDGASVRDPSLSKGEWCSHDIITGRPLPPWAPLRRCVVSGLLAAEITQQKSDGNPVINSTSPWMERWAKESPFGGRWARVPSLDLERFHLLPAIPNGTGDRVDSSARANVARSVAWNAPAANGANGAAVVNPNPQLMGMPPAQNIRPPNPAETVSRANAIRGASLPPQIQSPVDMRGIGAPGQPLMNQGVPSPGGANVHGAPVNAVIPPQMSVNGKMDVRYAGTPIGDGGVAVPGVVNGTRNGGQRVQPPLGPTPSTPDHASTTSKVKKPRGSRAGQVKRKRVSTEPGTPTQSQFSDITGQPGTQGMLNASPPAGMGGLRAATPSDALSTDSRSTATAATHATGGVDQEPTKRRRRTSKQRQQLLQQQEIQQQQQPQPQPQPQHQQQKQKQLKQKQLKQKQQKQKQQKQKQKQKQLLLLQQRQQQQQQQQLQHQHQQQQQHQLPPTSATFTARPPGHGAATGGGHVNLSQGLALGLNQGGAPGLNAEMTRAAYRKHQQMLQHQRSEQTAAVAAVAASAAEKAAAQSAGIKRSPRSMKVPPGGGHAAGIGLMSGAKPGENSLANLGMFAPAGIMASGAMANSAGDAIVGGGGAEVAAAAAAAAAVAAAARRGGRGGGVQTSAQMALFGMPRGVAAAGAAANMAGLSANAVGQVLGLGTNAAVLGALDGVGQPGLEVKGVAGDAAGGGSPNGLAMAGAGQSWAAVAQSLGISQQLSHLPPEQASLTAEALRRKFALERVASMGSSGGMGAEDAGGEMMSGRGLSPAELAGSGAAPVGIESGEAQAVTVLGGMTNGMAVGHSGAMSTGLSVGMPVGMSAGLPMGMTGDFSGGLSTGMPVGLSAGMAAAMSAGMTTGTEAGLPNGGGVAMSSALVATSAAESVSSARQVVGDGLDGGYATRGGGGAKGDEVGAITGLGSEGVASSPTAAMASSGLPNGGGHDGVSMSGAGGGGNRHGGNVGAVAAAAGGSPAHVRGVAGGRGGGPVAASGAAATDSGQRIWSGLLCVSGSSADMLVPCVAIQHKWDKRPPMRDASGWPRVLRWELSELKVISMVVGEMHGDNLQWYVRFAPVDSNGNEVEHAKFQRLVTVLVEGKLVIKIEVHERGGTPGTLYLWGKLVEPFGHSLLGVFKPARAPPPPLPMGVAVGVDADMAMGMMHAPDVAP